MLSSLRIFAILAILPIAANAQWSAPVKLSTTDTSTHLNENMGRCIAVSGDSVHVVWWDQSGTGSAVYYRHSFDGGVTWSDPRSIDGASNKADFTCIAVSGNYVHVAYRQDSTSWYVRSSDGGSTWSPRVSLGKYYWWPSIACSGATVCVALNSNDPGNSEVWFRRSTDNGATWDNVVRISNALGRSEDPSIAASNGHVYLVWNDNRDSLNGAPIMQAYSRQSSDNGVTWGPETLLNHPPASSYFPFISAVGSNADFVWGDRRGSTFQIFYKHSNDNGATWSAEQALSSAVASANAAYPVVTRNGNDVHVVFWYFNGGAIYRHSSDGGTTWDVPITVVDSSRKPGNTFIACSNNAEHIIWQDAHDGHPGVYYTRHVEQQSGGGTAVLSTDPLVNFGRVAITDHKDTTITLHNTGTATLSIDHYLLHAPFSLVDSSVHSIAAGSSASIQIRFTPNGRVKSIDSLWIVTNVGTSAIVLSGTGFIHAALSSNSASIQFGSVDSGTTLDKYCAVWNVGDEDGTIDSVTITGSAFFSIDSIGSIPLTVGQNLSVKFKIRFAPNAGGASEATLKVYSAAAQPITLILDGNGVSKPDTSTGGKSGVANASVNITDYRVVYGANGTVLMLSTSSPLDNCEINYFDESGRALAVQNIGPINNGSRTIPLELPADGVVFAQLRSRGFAVAMIRVAR